MTLPRDEQTKALDRIETVLRSMREDLVEVQLFDETNLGLLHGTWDLCGAKCDAMDAMIVAVDKCEALLGLIYTKTRLAAEPRMPS